MLPDSIVRLTQRAQHPVGHRPQVGPVGFESIRQQFVFVDLSHSLVAFRHNSDGRNPADVTKIPEDPWRRAIMQARMNNPAIIVPASSSRVRTITHWVTKFM